MELVSTPVDDFGLLPSATITHHIVVQGVSIILDSSDTIRVGGTVLKAQPRALEFLRWVIRNEGQLKKPIPATKKRSHPSEFQVSEGHAIYVFALMARRKLSALLQKAGAGHEDIIERVFGRAYYIRPERYLIPHIEEEIREYVLLGQSVKFLSNGDILLNERRITLLSTHTRIFEILLESEGRICTWNHIATILYGENRKMWPKSKIIDVFIFRLRKELAEANNGQHHIETVWGRGYRIAVPHSVEKSVHPSLIADNAESVVTLDGKRITAKDLPEPELGMRWVASKKAIVVKLLQANMLTIEAVLQYYQDMSRFEVEDWVHQYEKLGMPGLKTMKDT